MPLSIDLFIRQHLARHAPAEPLRYDLPFWLTATLVLMLSAAGLLYPHWQASWVLLPVWVGALGLSMLGALSWRALAASIALSLSAALLSGQLKGQVPAPLPLLLASAALCLLAGYLHGCLRRDRQALRRETGRAQRLYQLCASLAQAPGTCLQELDPSGRLLTSCESVAVPLGMRSDGGSAESNWLAWWQNGTQSRASRALRQAQAGIPAGFTGCRLDREGRQSWQEVLLMPVSAAQGHVQSLLVLCTDISDLRQSHVDLHNSRRQLSSLLDNLNDGFCQLDANGRFLQANARAKVLLNQGGELVGECLWELHPMLLKGELSEVFMEVLHAGIPRRIELHLPGLGAWYRLHAYPGTDGIAVLFSNIDAEVTARQHHQTTEARLRLTQEIGRFADWQLELSDQVLTLSSQALQLLGLPMDIIGNHQDALLELLHPEDRLTFVSALLDLTEDKTALSLLVRLRDTQHSGHWRDFQFAGLLLQGQARQVGLLIGCMQDVTDQQQRERRLIEAESFTRGMIDSLPQLIGVLDDQGRIVTTNQAWNAFLEDYPQTPLWAEIGTDYLALSRAAVLEHNAPELLLHGLEALLDGTGSPFELDYRITLADGEVRSFHLSVLLMEQEHQRLLVVFEDVSDKAQLNAALDAQAQRLRLVHEGTNDGLWEWMPGSGELYLSARFVELIGRDLADCRDFPHWLLDHAHPDDGPALRDALQSHFQQSAPFDIELRLAHPEGWRWFRARGKAQWENGTLVRFAGSLMDIGLQRELCAQIQASEARLREMVEVLPHVFWVYDVGRARIDYVSPALEKIWGLPAEQLYQDERLWLQLVHPDDLQQAERFHRRALQEHRPAEAEYRSLNACGDLLWIRNRAFPTRGEDGRVVRVVGIAENITEARSYRDKLRAVANVDSPSGLPNQAIFRKRLQLQCSLAQRNQQCFTVLFVSLDRLKWVQQCLGQQARDEIIRQVGQRLRLTLDGRGYLACLGDGEFGLSLLANERGREDQAIIQALLRSLSAPFQLEGESLTLRASIGAARFPEHGSQAEQLIRNTNAAVYATQRSGIYGCQFFHEGLLQQNQDTLQLEADLQRALEQQEFELYYQPKLCLRDQRLCGAEALVRWNHASHGLVAPLRFVHLLEDTGLIVPLGLWCIESALAQLAAWREQGLEGFVIAVNLSLKQLQPELPGQVRRLLRRYAVAPGCLELELTESTMHDEPAGAIVVNQLKSLGVRIAVDDFGTGYSNLGNLKSFVPDIIKIDKGFLRDMVTDAADQAIVRGVIDMAHALHMTVVAEGVECIEQKRLLERLHCDQIQGYLLSPPVDATTFEREFIAHCAMPALASR
ncbi:sensor domain-containing protein [Ectopseudomonas guguanensis]|uniref:sensor domain-containing protein n=1 Tax=Ectopseudomonas guguanensis TaxID=1198456 RepID=UPI00285A0625|nr:EAL domain-containing protein [Pseudomonas guguanensis]MDR8016821.1 EAL domain-containing protein [Pseudomonas guguanensis]